MSTQENRDNGWDYGEWAMDSLNGIRRPRVDTVLNAKGRFGYEATNPIPVCDIQGEKDYLNKLQCECGVGFTFDREGSMGGPDGHSVDKYNLCCSNNIHKITLFMDMYHEDATFLVPEGLQIASHQESSIQPSGEEFEKEVIELWSKYFFLEEFIKLRESGKSGDVEATFKSMVTVTNRIANELTDKYNTPIDFDTVRKIVIPKSDSTVEPKDLYREDLYREDESSIFLELIALFFKLIVIGIVIYIALKVILPR